MTTLPVSGCKLCAQGVVEISKDRSQREWSEIFDVAKSSVQRHMAHVQKALNAGEMGTEYTPLSPKHRADVDVEDEGDLSIANRYGIPETSITTRTISEWGNGKSEKITFRPNSESVQESLLDYDDVEKVIDSMDATQPVEVDVPHTMIVCAADFQVGKTDLLGGTEDLIRRVLTSLYKAADRARTEKPDTIILVDLGDIIENFKNTSAQRQTNDMDLTTQVRTARRIMAEAIKILAPLTNHLVVVSVPSNHCRVKEDFGMNPSSTPNDDWGIDINHSLEERFSDREDITNITFVRPPDNYTETVVLDLGDAGGVVGFVHGHQAKSQVRITEWLSGQVNGQRNNMHLVKTLFYGHFHNMKMEQSGNEKWIIGAPTSDAGSSWYSNLTGEVSTNGMLVVNLTGNGRWSNLEIL